MANILVCDDDKEIVEAIDIYLSQDGYHIFKAYDGIEAIEILEREDIHLLIMDIMMPRLDGIRATLKIRENSSIPIIILSAKSEDTDKILGLNIGADDYITKPFHYKEVVARIRSQLRRYMKLGGIHTTDLDMVQIGRLCYDFKAHVLCVDGEPVKLTSTETKIVELLVRHPGRIFSAEEIYFNVWNETIAFSGENTVMVHIRRIREKIEINPSEPEYLKVVWGIGYKFEKR